MDIRKLMSRSKEILGEAEQLAAVNEDGFNIRHIYNPSETVQLAAVNQNGRAIQFLHNPSETVQKAALDNDPGAIQYFKRAWLKEEEVKEMSVSELQSILGYKIKIVEDTKSSKE